MRKHLYLIVIVTVAFTAVTCTQLKSAVAAPPTPLEQAAIDALNLLLGNTPPATTPPSTGTPPANSPPAGGMLPSVVPSVNPSSSWTSPSQPRGTYAVVGGPGTQSQRINLPESISIDPNGRINSLNSTPPGNSLRITNNSPDPVGIEFIPLGGSTNTPFVGPPSWNTPGSTGSAGPATPPPNTRTSFGTGDIEVTNLSGKNVRVDYYCPQGKTYTLPNGGGTYPHVMTNPLLNGRTDSTPNIAENTEIRFDGYPGYVFYSPRNQTIYLTIHSNHVTAQYSAVSSPGPSPGPTPVPGPTPAPNPGPNPAPAPTPNPGTANPGVFPHNPIPKSETKPLTNAVSQALAAVINKDVASILNAFDRASDARVDELKSELTTAGLPPGAVKDILHAAKNGDPTALIALMKQSGSSSIPRSLQAALLASATFRKSHNELLVKFEAGNPASVMTQDFQGVKDLAATLGASGLTEAMSLTQQELLIRDKINRAAVSSVLSIGQQVLPTGSVTIIRHPGVNGQATFLGDGNLALIRSNDQNISVSVATAGAALGLPTSTDTPIAESKTNKPVTGITISNPAKLGKSVTYTLNGKQFTIQPNYSQELPSGTTWNIEFSPGGNAAKTQYSLTADGTYVFYDRSGKTDLATKEYRITMHNPTTSQIIYTFDNKSSIVLDAGKTTSHTSSHPMLVQFDRDGGLSHTSKLLQEQGDYYFALNGNDIKWDLFAGKSSTSSNAANGQVITIARPSLDSLQKSAGTMLFDFRAVPVTPSGGSSLLDDLLKAGQ